VPETNRRTKLSLYCLFTFHYASVRLHLIEYDIKTLQYVVRTEPVRFPSAGLHRTHHAAVKGGSGGNILSGTAAGELIVINESGRLFRASLPVTCNGMLSLLSIGDDMCVLSHQFSFLPLMLSVLQLCWQWRWLHQEAVGFRHALASHWRSAGHRQSDIAGSSSCW
jgi:hypothetical protein